MAVIQSPALHGFDTCADRRLHIGDRGCGLEPRIVARAQTEQKEVIVVVDKPRNGRASAEIDHLHARTAIRVAVVADLRELPVLDRRGRYDRIASVEVWIFPLTNFRSREPAQRSSSPSRARAGVNIVTPAINDDTTNNETRLRVFMTPPLSFFSALLPSTA